MNEKQRKLIDLLKEMFQLNQTDLDFGIYRIMNQKSDEINDFLNNQLIQSIKNAFINNNGEGLQKELDEAIKNALELGANPESLPKVKELKEQISSSSNTQDSENEIYSYLTNFFSRYYKDGDFVSLRRYKKDTYSIPYEGEEVKLHWANSDQYYIKTSEFFRDYTFMVDKKKFHFKIVDADTEKNNNKANSDSERRFVINENNPMYEEDGELYIRFEYKPVGKIAQNKLNEKAIEVIFAQDNELVNDLKQLSPTQKNKNRTILEKHLVDYTSRNSFDYFIHKDLNGFLSRELDFYIKNEILYIDDILETSSSKIEDSLNKIKIFKTIANKVIAFLSQLEEFQKKLWLKKKFVIDTNYCITLDKIPQSYYEEILTNKEQLKEWKALFSVEISSIEDLLQEKFLVLDTKFFSTEFKNKILSQFDNIDEECDGVLINSENFGALNLLQDRYKEQIKTIYIDPPYNKGNDFAYKDNYQHSSWLSLMIDRLDKAYSLVDKKGFLFGSIDENEVINFSKLKALTSFNDFKLLPAITNLKGNQDTEGFVSTHEYILTYTKGTLSEIGRLDVDEETILNDWKEDKYGLYKKVDGLRATGTNAPRNKRPNLWYPIFINEETKKFYTTEDNTPINESDIKLLPINDKGEELSWYWKKSKVNDENYNLILTNNNGKYSIYKKQRPNIGDLPTKKPKSFFYDAKYSSTNGGNELKKLFNKRMQEFTPKAVGLIEDILKIGSIKDSIIFDFFAGSGTTGHATINMNRKKGKRKFILVEMGEHFESVLKPRIQKVIYTDNWKDGKPLDKNGVSQMFKYFKLESYEDTLNNLAFKKADENLFSDDVKEDYLLNYMLDYETSQSLLNIDNFKKPFDYKLNIASSSVGETTKTNIDLVETFNYLIGLKIKTRIKIDGFLKIEGENLKEEKVLIIWRDDKTNDELNEFVKTIDLESFDILYTNGDNNQEFKLIEEEFKNRMFDA